MDEIGESALEGSEGLFVCVSGDFAALRVGPGVWVPVGLGEGVAV